MPHTGLWIIYIPRKECIPKGSQNQLRASSNTYGIQMPVTLRPNILRLVYNLHIVLFQTKLR